MKFCVGKKKKKVKEKSDLQPLYFTTAFGASSAEVSPPKMLHHI